MQDMDFEWFKENMPSLYEMYGHCFLAIKDKRVIGAYGKYADAVRETAKTEPMGSFIVQECGEDENVYTNFISSANFLMVTA